MATGSKRPGFLLDFAVAALAAASVAFVVFAMPDWRFNQAVAMSGLPSILSAAQPPLGNTARFAAMLAAAAIVFASVWLLLGALGKPPRRRSDADDPWTEGNLRLRRADMHPDAPTFRPLYADRELSEPDDELADFEEMLLTEEADKPPLPRFLMPDDEAEEEPDDLPCFHGEPSDAEAAEESEPAAANEDAPAAPEENVPPAAAAPAAPRPEPEEVTITDLMRRLDRGLERRGRRLPAQAPGSGVDLETRLRSAIEDLQRIAGRSF